MAIKKHEVKDNDYDAVLEILPDSKIELKAKTGNLTAYNHVTKSTVTIKFKKSSLIYKLLSGYNDIKPIYRKPRLIAVEINNKSEAVILTDKRLKQVEKKFKKLMTWKNTLHGTLGIKE